MNFVNDNGGPLTVPSVGGSSITLTLAPRGTAVVEAPDNGVLNQGYVAVELPGAVTGYGVFRQSIAGIADQEAVVPLASAISNASTFVFDETNYTTAVALVNPSPIPTTVNVTLRDANGALIGQASVPLSARSKLAAVLRTLPGLSAMAGKRGAADFTVGFGNVAVLGLRFSGAAFTSIPATEK